MKSIVFYIGSLSRGGAERVIVNLAEFFFSQGYQVTIVTKMKEKTEYEVSEGIHRILADIEGEEISSGRIKNLYRRIYKLRNIFKQIQPDCIVSFIGKNNFMSIAASRGLHIPVIVSVRSAPDREYAGRINKLLVSVLFGMAEGVVLQTTQARAFFRKGIQKKSVILPNPLNPNFVKEPFTGKRKKEIVWVGRMDENKNPRMLLEAFHHIYKQHEDWKVIYYGDGEQKEQLEELCIRYHLQDKVRFAGKVDGVENLIDKASVFCLTSRVEGMPNALLEAMALGVVPISTDCPCGGPRDLIRNGINGILIPVDDIDALAQALDELLSDENKRNHMSAEAYKILEKNHPDYVNRQCMTYIEKTKEKEHD